MASKKLTGVQGKVLNSQTREIIANVMKFMEKEGKDGLRIPLANFKVRVLAATGIGESTYRNIRKQKQDVDGGRASGFTTPGKIRKRDKPKSDLCDSEIEMIRSIIHNYCIVDKRRPTLKGIYQKILESGIEFKGKLSTLSTIVKRMGFRWKKSSNNRKVITESYDMRYKRIIYIQQLQKCIKDKRPVIYMDEFKQPIAKGQHLVIVHAGGRVGFIPDALLMLTSGSKMGDNRGDMDHEILMQWIVHKLLPNLPPKSVLVIDNASYYNVQIIKDPTPSTKKQDMVTWLAQRYIDHDPDRTKPELYQIIKRYKQTCNEYVLDVELQKHGHHVLRLPPFHPELNPMKRMWALVKNWVASQNMTTFKPTEMQELVRRKFSTITTEEWEKICDCVDKIADEYLAKEHLLDLDEFVSVINDSDDDIYSEEDDENYKEESGVANASDSE